MTETPAGQLQAARDAAEIRLSTAAADAIDEYATAVHAAVLADGGPPQVDALPTAAEWAAIAGNALTDALVAEYLAIWELGEALLDVLSGPDIDVAAIAAAWLAVRQQLAEDYARAALERLNGIPAQMQEALHSVMNTVVLARGSNAEARELVADEITEFAPDGGGMWRAERIGQTEATALAAAAQQAQAEVAEQTLRAAGHGGGLRKQWLTREDERVRHSHADVHAQVVDVTGTFVVGGLFMLYPGDPAGGPDQVVNCRCELKILGPEGLTAGGTPMSRPPTNYLPTVSMRLDHSSSPGASPAAARALAARARNAQKAQKVQNTGAAQLASGGEPELPDGWRGVLAPLDTLSGDGRMIKSAAGVRSRPYPLPFLAQESLEPGHFGAVGAGRIDRIWVEGGNLMGEGRFDLSDEQGRAWARRMADGFAGGVSVDLDDVIFSEHFIDRETGEEMDVEDALEILWFGEDPNRIEYQMHMDDWRLIGHTAVYHPAFFQAQVQPVFGYEVSGEIVEYPAERAAAAIQTEAAAPRRAAAASASAALLAAGVPAGPAEPPATWFEAPTLPGPTPITVDDDGRVFGHIALWNSCHTGSPDVCIAPPRTSNNYALFHTGEVVTREGDRMSVGRMTVGGGHADPWAPVPGAIEHYDNTGAVVAVVRATEDAYGIVVAGALHPHATKQQVADFMLSPPSGDWRRVGANLELVAVLSVNTPGYPVTRPRAAASDNRQISLVASGVPPVNRHGGRVTRLQDKPGPQYLSATLARSIRRSRLEQIQAQLADVPDPWAATRQVIAGIEEAGKNVELIRASARRHGFRG
jgi:hypothetical protein